MFHLIPDTALQQTKSQKRFAALEKRDADINTS
jgi:hypothetical protein